LRALAVTTSTRSGVLPDVPTVGEFIAGYEASAWYGIGAPRGTSSEIIGKLNSAINGCLAETTFAARLAEIGGLPFVSSPADFGHFIAAETDKWAKVIKFAGIRQE
jgi:tripartite-type tricarboxylate transporter receptor subunit TctC